MTINLNKGIRAVGILIIALFILIAIISPIILLIFWDYLEGYKVGPLLTAIAIVFIIGILGMILFGKQIKESIAIRKSADNGTRIIKTAKINKMIPFIMIGIVLITYNYYAPHWIYSLGVQPEFGPYIAIHGAGGMQISWDSRVSTTSVVNYGTSKENLNETAYGGQYFWQTDPKMETNHHCVLLQNLKANQTYYYNIPSIDETIHNFQTPPVDNQIDEIVFTILGDTQGNLNIQQNNIARMKSSVGTINRWDFTIIAGDLSNRDDDISQWAMVFDKTSYGGIASRIPLMTCSGNHETSMTNPEPPRDHYKQYFQNSFASNWTNPDNNYDIGTYYSFNYSNVHISMVDSLENKSHSLSDRQMQWLNQDLTNAKAAGMWTFLVFHSSMYSTSDHGPYPILADQIEPLMKTYEIDAVFYGHDHIYESFHVFSNESYGGTYCFMVAGGGGSLKDVTNEEEMGSRVWEGKKNSVGNYINNISNCVDNRFASLRGSEWQLYAERVHHYMQVEIYDTTANLTAYRSIDGTVIQTYTLTKHS